jgi:hypothetical protein
MQPNNCFHPDYYPDIFLPFVWSNFEDWRYDDWQDEYHYDDYPQMSHISPHMATIHLHGCKGEAEGTIRPFPLNLSQEVVHG